MKTLQELCLASGENFTPERLQRLEQMLIEDQRTDMPWYLRAIVAIGAWVASWFFLGFVITLIGWQEEHETTIGCIGVALLIATVVVGRKSWGAFVSQCALAVSFAGQIMIYYGFLDQSHHALSLAVVFSIVLAAVLYITFPSFLSRLATCLLALQVTLFWIYSNNTDDGLLDASWTQSDISSFVLFYWAFHLAGIGFCFLRPRHSVLLAPLGYALVLSLSAWQMEGLFNLWTPLTVITYSPAWLEWMVLHLRVGMTAITFFVVSIWAAGGMAVLRQKAPLFIGLILALLYLVALGSGGVILALLLLLLGFSLQHHAILGLGLILFPIFLTHYYYNLDLDLLAKSGVLIGSGFVMLLLRGGISRWLFPSHKEAA